VTAVATLLAGIKERAEAAGTYRPQPWRKVVNTAGDRHGVVDASGCVVNLDAPGTAEFFASAPRDMGRLIQALEAVEDLAKVWNAKGEHDMVYSKTIPDEDIAMELLTHGADMVEKARILRTAVAAALGGGE
jgi:hypothetical protein